MDVECVDLRVNADVFNCRASYGEQFLKVVDGAAKYPITRQWRGYWKRNPKAEAAE